MAEVFHTNNYFFNTYPFVCIIAGFHTSSKLIFRETFFFDFICGKLLQFKQRLLRIFFKKFSTNELEFLVRCLILLIAEIDLTKKKR